MKKTLTLDKKIILDLLSKRSFYKYVEAFASLESTVETVHRRLQKEGILNPDGTINSNGCRGCKARQFQGVQDNLVDNFVNALIQLDRTNNREQLNKLKEFLAIEGHTAEEVMLTYKGPCTKKEEVVIKF